MYRFIKKVMVFMLIMIASVIMLISFHYFVVGNQYSEIHTASIREKINRLNSIQEPKIILIGNSNVCFGFSSDILEREMKMPVVNLGLHGGLGNAFHEEIAKPAISRGDIVIVCHTDYSNDDFIKNPMLAWSTIEWDRDLWYIIRPKDYLDMIWTYPRYAVDAGLLFFKGSGNLPIDECYSRRAFNMYGDCNYERNVNVYDFTPSSITVPQIDENCIKRLNEYNQLIQERDATLLVAGYPIASGEFTPPKEEYDKFQQELEAKLDCEVISDVDDYLIPYSYFYDTALHLTNDGAKLRTQLLIDDLKKWMNK